MDALLDGLDRLIAKKRDLKKAAMQQLLTAQTRLPGFHGEWEVKRLGEAGTFLKGSGVKKDEADRGDLPCIRYGEIYTHHNDYIRIVQLLDLFQGCSNGNPSCGKETCCLPRPVKPKRR